VPPETRVMRVSEILETSWRLLRAHFGLLFGISALACVPSSILFEIPAALAADGSPFPWLIGAFFVVLILVLSILAPLVACMLTFAAVESQLGRPVTWGRAFAASRRRFLPLAGTYLLSGLAILAGLLLLVVPGIYLVFAFALLTPVILLEGRAGMDALGRSQELMRGNMLRLCGFYLAIGGVSLLAGLAITPLRASPGAILLGTTLINTLVGAYTAVGVAVFYLDVRACKEDFDRSLSTPAVASGDAPAEPPPTR